jgi:poly(3-hydroxybutyrate) depolymerase
MRVMRRAFLSLACAALLVTVVGAGTAPAALEPAIRAFFSAGKADPADRDVAKAIRGVLASGATFDEIAARLERGRSYAAKPTGPIPLPSTVNGLDLDNVVEVPSDYTPDRRWPLRVSLHGGVGRPAPRDGGSRPRPLTNRTPIDGEIVLHPRAYAEAMWWTVAQVDNVMRLVDRVKRAYNVDESRVYITGVSDGGTGVYFFAMRAATPWAACMPMNGHPLVLANPDTRVDGELFAGNLANCPLQAVNGGQDPLYPATSVKPFIDMFKAGGIPLVWHVYPNARHDERWWPDERASFESFLMAHPRAANPDMITWETERTDRSSRFRWLVIHRLGRRPSDAELPDINLFESGGSRHPLYERDHASGRVDVTRHGNAFEAKTRGVAQFTLLLSPDVIDFAQPVNVVVNGRTAFDGMVKKDPATLLEWAARDDDRTMLYGAALPITVP